MGKYDPPPSEYRFRIIASVVILAIVVFALIYRGLPTGPASIEAIVSGVIFGSATIAWSVWKLKQRGKD
ncbi:MAG: hypothetical protein AAF367_04770 [Pseudomonadota bacterium]